METVALTYKELADRLRIKVESARKTVQRKRWHRTTGNDGTVRIHVPMDILPSAVKDRSSPKDIHGDSPSISVHIQLAKLEAEITGLKELLQVERSRTIAAEQDRDAWKEQAQILTRAKVQEPRSFLSKIFRKNV